MSFYPPKINEIFQHPEFAGALPESNTDGVRASFICGSFVSISMQIDPETKTIIKAKFRSNGCGYMIAAAEVLVKEITGKKLLDLHGFDKEELSERIENVLVKFSDNRRHCLQSALDALQSALSEYRAQQIEEFAGEKALICTCFGISEDTIENVIRNRSLDTVEQVTETCSAGGGCGACQPLVQEILDVLNREIYDIIENY